MLHVLLSILLTQVPELICDPTNPAHCSQPVAKGQVSLMDGMVLSLDLALFLGQKADRADANLKLELSRASKIAQADQELAVSLVKADLTVATASAAAQARQSQYWQARAERAELKLSEGPPFYLHPIMVFTYGVVVTAIITAIVMAELHLAPSP